MRIFCGIAFLFFSLLFVACKSDSTPTTKQNTDSSEITTDQHLLDAGITALSKELPDEFKALSIPLFKNADVQRVHKHNHNTGDKFQITFKSKASPKEIEEYYLKAMKKNGWKITNSTKKSRPLDAYFSIYNNGEKQLIINAVPDEKKEVTTVAMILMDYPAKNKEKEKENQE